MVAEYRAKHSWSESRLVVRLVTGVRLTGGWGFLLELTCKTVSRVLQILYHA